MNLLYHIREDMPVAQELTLSQLIYVTFLSSAEKKTVRDKVYAVSSLTDDVLEDYFPSSSTSELSQAFNELCDKGYIDWDDATHEVFLGEIVGNKFFPLRGSSLLNAAMSQLRVAIDAFSGSHAVRANYIYNWVNQLKVDSMTPQSFTELHAYLYEMYTGGEMYRLRGKTEDYHTITMLRHYNKEAVFAILVEGVLHYSKYRKRGVPTLTALLSLKDDIFKSLISNIENARNASGVITEGF